MTVSFWHCMPVSKVKRSTLLVPGPRHSSKEYLPAYKWLEERVGYFPMFLAAGNEDEAPYTTGYHNQWRVSLSQKKCPKSGRLVTLKRRKAGRFPNLVMFRFDEAPSNCTFMDSSWWAISVMNGLTQGILPAEPDVKRVFKRSWSRNRWLNKAAADGCSVELVVPQLDLSKTSSVWVRNQATADRLTQLGYTNVQVRRIAVDAPWQ